MDVGSNSIKLLAKTLENSGNIPGNVVNSENVIHPKQSTYSREIARPRSSAHSIRSAAYSRLRRAFPSTAETRESGVGVGAEVEAEALPMLELAIQREK